MKKILSVVLVIALLGGLCACGNNSSNQKHDNEYDVVLGGNDKVEDISIRENGKLPESFDELTEYELWHYFNVMLEASKTFDMETFDQYVSEKDVNSYWYRRLIEIKDNSDYNQMWKNVMKDVYFFEDQGIYVTKCWQYIKDKWFTDMYDSGAEIS